MLLLNEIKRIVTRWNFIASILFVLAIQAFGFWQYIKSFSGSISHSNANEAVFYTYFATQLFLPLSIGLLVGDTVAYDRSSGMIRLLLFRISRPKYVWYKAVSAGVISFLTTFFSLSLSGILICIFLPHVESASNASPYTSSAVHFLPGLFWNNIYEYTILSSGYTSFCAVFMGTLSVFVGAIQRNTLIAVAFPWFVYIGLSVIGISIGIGQIAPLAWSTVVEYSPAIQGSPWVPPLVWTIASVIIAVVAGNYIRRDIVD
ncbi:hypothetical protein [Alicyclobacillus herbarius]|uniref:hypothetical protein n=1 Tax=Alicyclobacillus herbarius TaxID=122960 RepID=UPI0012DBF0E3|nr:hypothetical protein [Alicyclobacillus herbarius]